MNIQKNKTSLLISVDNKREIKKIKNYVDVIDLKNPIDGALGAWEQKEIQEIISTYKNEIIISATLGNLQTINEIKKKINLFENLGLDYLKVGFFKDSVTHTKKILDYFKNLNFKTKLVAVLFAENKNIIKFALNNFNFFKQSNINTILMDTKNKKSLGTLEIFSDEFFKNFIMSAKIEKINIGIAGKIKIMDLNRLLRLKPNLVGIRGAACISNQRESSISVKSIKKIKSYFIEETKNAQDVAGA